MTLDSFFASHPAFALAFSGGTDSALLLAEALRAHVDVLPLFARTPFVSQEEFQHAQKISQTLGAPMSIIDIELLADPEICANPSHRCYLCKTRIFSALMTVAHALGYPCLADGTNASDDDSQRPGMRALRELGVLSPLREAGLSKLDIRTRAKSLGLDVWNRPSQTCLATRIPSSDPITLEKLARIANAENSLHSMGFDDIRVRLMGSSARIQTTPSQWIAMAHRRDEILKALTPWFEHVTLDLACRDETELPTPH